MFSQTTEYALRAMMHLSTLEPGVSVTTETIAERVKVPQGYLSKILRDLVVAELIVSQRGPNGGFSLARPSQHISMLDVVNAVDPIERIRTCPLGNPEHLKLCPLHQRIDAAIANLESEFGRTSLAEVLNTNVNTATHCRHLISPGVPGKRTRK